MRKLLIVLALVGGCGRAEAKESFMPDNDLYKEDVFYNNPTARWDGITPVNQAIFNEIIDRAQGIYGPIAAKFGVRLQINKLWSDPTVNAQAYQQGSTWYVDMFGGLARRREINAEGFVIVLCHEIGHHFGGYPTYQGEWASAEGQSDYFSTHVCVKKMFAQDASYIKYLSRVAVDKCKRFYRGQDLNVCYHSMSGSKSCADLLGTLNGESAAFETPSADRPSSTNLSYPSTQCRLDTMAAGSVCTTAWRDTQIPRDPNTASSVNCPDGEGARPRCWFVR